MSKLSPLTLTLLIVASQAVNALTCPSSANVVSCSADAADQEPCCVPSPGGAFLFRQRFEADKGDEGRWGIDGLDVLEYVSKTRRI